MTMWVDTERLFPLKLSMEFGGTTSTIRYENLTLNPDYPADAFAFDPPANATVREPQTPNVSEFESHAALADATDRPLPEASLPRGFTFERGSVVDGNSTVVSLTYTDGDRQLSVVVTDTRARESDGETVTVGDRTGTYREFGDRGSLAWTCGDTRYAVLGPVERETLVDVGAAIDC
jgi:negative regulator of sigma E activity